MGDERSVSDVAVARAVAFAAEAGTAQLVIVRSGDVVVDEVDEAEPVDVFAVQKGLVSVMFGIAEERELLHLDDPVSDFLGVGWTRLPRASEARLTIGTVLDMTTGMDDELRPLGEVGVSWRYDNVAYNYLKTVLEIVTGTSLSEVTRAWLFEPLGMDSTSWVERPVLRPDGRPITGLLSTARDLARFGAMVLAGGNGVAPSAYLGSLGRPGSGENPAWGLCWWNNDQRHHRLPRAESKVQHGSVTPQAPADMIAARGAMENHLYVVPSLDLVVARTAKPVRRGRSPVSFDRSFWEVLAGEPGSDGSVPRHG
ncbi:MAG: serine hydrolase domain-containing protein [Ilumatobacter sp.]|uniref:serine hydrolase domain-containing protein n=1 Tax=Ilumatobacter sp. TaxID=1967498 RepID=UPI002610D059|nr:serine hydrolase domain-containing protein [Ilumatobacter sp.]MDJ0770116.1 serine hydrolase domain-containing protein [Ilumatobacter sp.]